MSYYTETVNGRLVRYSKVIAKYPKKIGIWHVTVNHPNGDTSHLGGLSLQEARNAVWHRFGKDWKYETI